LKQSVQVTILGQQYTVRSDSDPEEVRRVAEFVNQRINEAHQVARTANSLTAVVLALLNVAAELVQAQSQLPAEGDGEGRLQRLLARIEAACKEGEVGSLSSTADG
jgi:cell division protein ZapA